MKYHQLSQEERYIITSLLKSHLTLTEIGRQMGRATSTISRELSRNLRPSGYYAAFVAESYATARRKSSRRGSQFTPDQWSKVLRLIEMDYSPEQVAHIIPQFFGFSISHETIYQYILYDKKKGGSWYKHLRIMPKRRRKRYNSHDSRGRLAGKRMIDERPDEINQRLSIGHWEADTVIGKDRKHCIVTLVERKTGYLIIKKVQARTVEEINKACIAAINEHGQYFKTITFDNGTEFHGYKILERRFPVTCYFAHAYHSWERGTNENTNGLIRQYIPKRTCMKHISQSDCNMIAYKLNMRPRKRLGFKTPFEVYYETASPLHFTFEPKFLFYHYIYII